MNDAHSNHRVQFASNGNIHFHMIFLDGVYVEGRHGTLERFQWVKSPTSEELARLTHTIARRVGRFLERQGLIESDAENSHLALDSVDDDSMAHLVGHSITYRIAMGSANRTQGVYPADLAGLRS